MNTPDLLSPSSTLRPWHLARQYAEQFQDQSVVDAYHLRPYYPEETFSLLADLCDPVCPRVLDAGCGTGEIARRIAPLVEHVDAVDLSPAMLTKGKGLPGGDAANLRWIEGEIETVALAPPYGLITAASSLHWMEWAVALPRFAQMLTPNGVLVILFDHASTLEADTGEIGQLVRDYSTNRDYQPFDLVEELQERHLFTVRGKRWTQPVLQKQSIADFVGSIHARNGFSRERMGAEAAGDFDTQVLQILRATYPEGDLTMSVQMKVVWGKPSGSELAQ